MLLSKLIVDPKSQEEAVLKDRAWVHVRNGFVSCWPQHHLSSHPALAPPHRTTMAPDSKPKKTVSVRSRFQRLFSSSSGARDGRSGEPVARDLQALMADSSLTDNSKGPAPSSGEECRVPIVGPERGNARAIAESVPSSMRPSASTLILPLNGTGVQRYGSTLSTNYAVYRLEQS
jgi:hypothetical protein